MSPADIAALRQAAVLCKESDPQTDEIARVAEMQAAADDDNDLLEAIDVPQGDDNGQRVPSSEKVSSSSAASASFAVPVSQPGSSSSSSTAPEAGSRFPASTNIYSEWRKMER